jgi:uncharacterized repeat protein (TIGR03803 family)
MRNRLSILAALTVTIAVAAHAQTYTRSTLHNFNSANPVGTVTVDSAGNLYGALGWTGACQPGKTPVECGLIFKLNSNGQETVVHNFSALATGADPVAPLTLDAAGNLYGVTTYGGHTSSTFAYGLGVIFKITPQGKFSILHRFAAGGFEGALPDGPLTIDAGGNLYGTTIQGGNSSLCNLGCGVVFKVSAKGAFSVLHALSQTDGEYPKGNLIVDPLGNIYGTTTNGGPVQGPINASYGVLFELTPSGQETVLYTFLGDGESCDGCNPTYVVRDSAGNFYGSGSTQSPDFDGGVLYEINTSESENFSYYFCPGVSGLCPNGATPSGKIVDSAGLLYGTTAEGGGSDGNGQGVVYQLSPGTGIETVLYSFPADASEGREPQGISADSQGNLYGTASFSNGIPGGLVFKLTKSQ